MASLISLQRPSSAPLPRTDIQIAIDFWKYLHRQIQKHRQRRRSKAEAKRDYYDSGSEVSIMSKADTLVPSKESSKESI
ncbi:hypothetical protein N7454_007328 [Penicillium verhagenii]|nr:hypothetical protein N7454_007328 [Penicillium verhagenii]